MYGHNFVGTRAGVARQHVNWGPRISAIPIACTAGLLDVGIYRGNVDANTFLEFIRDHLVPNLLLFNGVNPHSVVIMGKPVATNLRGVDDHLF